MANQMSVVGRASNVSGSIASDQLKGVVNSLDSLVGDKRKYLQIKDVQVGDRKTFSIEVLDAKDKASSMAKIANWALSYSQTFSSGNLLDDRLEDNLALLTKLKTVFEALRSNYKKNRGIAGKIRDIFCGLFGIEKIEVRLQTSIDRLGVLITVLEKKRPVSVDNNPLTKAIEGVKGRVQWWWQEAKFFLKGKED